VLHCQQCRRELAASHATEPPASEQKRRLSPRKKALLAIALAAT
jgi:hypothetical protein